VIWFEDLTIGDVGIVGGRTPRWVRWCANLAPKGIEVPSGLRDERRRLPPLHHGQRAERWLDRRRDGAARIRQGDAAGDRERIRQSILEGEWPEDTEAAIRAAYAELARRTGKDGASVAVRSSATAEDLPDASFAGQQETFLNVVGIGPLLDTCRRCYASLFTDRAITYRQLKGFDWSLVALSVGVQLMARSDIGGRVSCSPSTRNRASTRPCSSTRPGVWARTSCRAR
jgi:pyruvate, water dikinase